MHLDKSSISEKLRQHILGKCVSPPSDYRAVPTKSDHKMTMSYMRDTSLPFDSLLGPFPLRYHKSKENIRCAKREHSVDLPPDSTINPMKRKRGRPPKKGRKVAIIEPESKPIEIVTYDNVKEEKVEKFQHFRKRMLQQIYKENENRLQSNYHDQMEIKSESETETIINPLAEYKVNQNINPTSESIKDEEYLEKRKRNNESAKKSRAKRKLIEDGILARVAFLENENYELKLELEVMKYQMALLKAELKNQQT